MHVVNLAIAYALGIKENTRSKDEVVEFQPSIGMDFWVEGNELIVVWNMRDGFLQ